MRKSLFYTASIEPSTGRLVRLRMTPTRIKNFRVNYASRDEAVWFMNVLNREGKALGTRAEVNDDNSLTLHWKEPIGSSLEKSLFIKA